MLLEIIFCVFLLFCVMFNFEWSLFGLAGALVLGLGGVGEVFVARVVAGGKVTIPLLVREVLKIEEGDYVRITITEVIRRKKQERKVKKERAK